MSEQAMRNHLNEWREIVRTIPLYLRGRWILGWGEEIPTYIVAPREIVRRVTTEERQFLKEVKNKLNYQAVVISPTEWWVVQAEKTDELFFAGNTIAADEFRIFRQTSCLPSITSGIGVSKDAEFGVFLTGR